MNQLFNITLNNGTNVSTIRLTETSNVLIWECEDTTVNRISSEGIFGRFVIKEAIFSTGILQSFRILLESPVQLAFMTTENSISILYCLEGYCFIHSHDKIEHLLAKTQVFAVFTGAGENFQIDIFPASNKKNNLLALSIPVMSSATDISSTVKEMRVWFSKNEPAIRALKCFNSTIDLELAVSELVREIDNENIDRRLLEAYANILILEVINYVEQAKTKESSFDEWDPEKRAVHLLAESIILSLDEPLTVKGLAAEQNINPTRLKFVFKKYMGMTVAAFKIEARMQKARQLLKETPLSIQEISSLVGYSNASQFSTMFKKKFGYAPKQLRK